MSLNTGLSQKRQADSSFSYRDSRKQFKHVPPDPDDMNNKRAAAAERALLSFSMDAGEWHCDLDLTEQNLMDLLGDLAHFCDRRGLDMAHLLEMVRNRYAEETDDEGQQFAALIFTREPGKNQ